LRQKPGSRLPELVQWCKTRNIPTAFWNKEDPPHYDGFIDAARLFDYVFTSDAGCMEEYKKDLGHSNIFCLPFAAQPRIHNPIGSGQKIRDVAFAGTWHATETEDKKHRREQMADVLAPVLPYGVDIYDRNFGSKDARYRFPERYQPNIVGQLPYDEMVYAYKIYKIFLNVNSVMDSPTMFPRRVLEILASGTCVLSGYCKGIENMLGTHTVPMSSSPEETELLLKKLLKNKEVRDRLAHAGLRKVMKEHTCEKRVGYILKTMGLHENEGGDKDRGVSVITSTNKLGYMDSILANYNRQAYEDKELIIVLNNNQLNLEEWGEKAKSYPNVTVCQLDEKEGLGTCLNFGVDRARFEYIAKFDDDDYYAPLYLEDLMMAFDYSGADIVGKSTYYVYFEKDTALAIRFPGREHGFREFVSGPTMVMKRGVFEKIRFDSEKGRGSDTRFQRKCVRNGFRIYSADRFNFAVLRSTSKDMHTWKITDEELMEASEVIAFTDDYVPYITD
jgi:spore maturation protein CgeB